jgi:hypothetical protein
MPGVLRSRLELEIQAQPDDSTCGPTCLHGVYRFYGDALPLPRVIREIAPLASGGTLAVQLACHALRRGYAATIYTYNLSIFDPTWFERDVDLPERLRAQAEAKEDPRIREATASYLEFLSLGGRVRFEELGTDLLRRFLEREQPILTGLSATYLYGCRRESGEEVLVFDDVRGVPVGHFVILCGYDPETRRVLVADPLQDNPGFGSHSYEVGVNRVLGAILLGALTYDANLLLLEPGAQRREGTAWTAS